MVKIDRAQCRIDLQDLENENSRAGKKQSRSRYAHASALSTAADVVAPVGRLTSAETSGRTRRQSGLHSQGIRLRRSDSHYRNRPQTSLDCVLHSGKEIMWARNSKALA